MDADALFAALVNLKCTGKGTCEGGAHPHPPFHDYPLLTWKHKGHHKFGTGVFLEDQKASVEEVVLALAENPSVEAMATKFGTSREHISQAIAYAVKAGVLGS